MKILTLAALIVAGLAAPVSAFAADNPAQTAPTATQPPSHVRKAKKPANPQVLKKPYAAPHNGAASAIGAE